MGSFEMIAFCILSGVVGLAAWREKRGGEGGGIKDWWVENQPYALRARIDRDRTDCNLAAEDQEIVTGADGMKVGRRPTIRAILGMNILLVCFGYHLKVSFT